MEVVSSSRFPCAAITWRSRRIGWVVTVVTKTTFSLVPGESEVAPKQRRMSQSDAEGEPNILRKPNDFVPFKTRPEVLLVGSAFAPRKSRVGRLVARLVVGEVDKQIEVHADRWMTRDGEIMPGAPFERMPLGWDRAAGGPGTNNPIGIPTGTRDERGRRRLPNLQPIGAHVTSQDDPVEPVGFGPIPAAWPSRKQLLGPSSQSLLTKRWFDEPLSDDFDPAFFNAAPSDQRVEALPADLHLVLENLTPIAPRFVTNLPRVEPSIIIERGVSRQALHPLVDTLLVDTDRGICTLTWRVHTPIGTPAEKGRILIEFEGHQGSSEISDFETMTGGELDGHDGSMPAAQTDAPKEGRDVLPFRGGKPASVAPPPPSSSRTAVHGSELPPPRHETGPPPPPRRASPPATLLGRDPIPQELRDVLPFTRDPSGPRTPSSRPEPHASRPATGPESAQPQIAPPALASVVPGSAVAPPPHAGMAIPPPAHASATPAPPVPPIASSIGASPSTGLPSAWSPSPSVGAAQAALSAATAPPLPAPVLRHDDQAVPRGAVAASDAAADRQETPGPRPARRQRQRARELVDLLWFDDEAPTRVRQRGEWFSLLRDDLHREPEWIVGEAAEQELAAAKDRRDVARALARVPASEAAEIATILQESVDEDGVYERPLLVVTGELQMSFEPLEVLRHSTSLAAQFASADKRLKDAVDAAQAALTGDAKPPARLIESLLGQLRQVFTQTNRSLSSDYLESSVQELLLEQRQYTKRTVLGGPRLRALFVPAGGGTHAMPAYLPEQVRDRLPLFERFRVRMLVEPHPQQDPNETVGLALVALAIARVAPIG